MKRVFIILSILLVLYTACSAKSKPKLCKVVISEPSKAELDNFKNSKKLEKNWQKRR